LVTPEKSKRVRIGMIGYRLLGLLVVVGMIMAFSACASAPLSTAAPTSTQASTSASNAPVASVPPSTGTPPADFKKGGIFRLAQMDEPARFGIPWATNGADAQINSMVCEPLISPTDKPGVFLPVLAESYEFNADKSILTFHLRKGIKFQDGTDFNAQAVAWTWQHRWDDEGPVVFELSPWKSWELVDDYTLKVNLKYWTTVLLNDFAGGKYGMMSPTAFDKNGKDYINTHPIGTGPWLFKDYSRGQFVKLVRNPSYWRNNGTPYLDEVWFLTYKDTMVTQAAMKHGDFELWRGLDVDSANMMATVPGIKVDHSGYQNNCLYYNAQEGIWKDLKMRQALEYAIDKQTICDTFGNGFYQPIYECLPGADTLGKDPIAPRKYDPAKAKQLMAEAGYPNGLAVNLKLDANNQVPAVLSLQNELAKVGIKLNFIPLQGSAWGDLSKVSPEPGELRFERQRGNAGSIVAQTRGDFGRSSPFFMNRPLPNGWFDEIDKLLLTEDPVQIANTALDLNAKAYETLMILPLWSIVGAVAYVEGFGIYVPPDPTFIKMTQPFQYNNSFTFKPEWLYYKPK
jgi:ABC-type transport system substrate-binding protein